MFGPDFVLFLDPHGPRKNFKTECVQNVSFVKLELFSLKIVELKGKYKEKTKNSK